MGQTQKSECATGKSALPSTTGIVSQTCQVRKVPIVLKKSFCGDDQNISGPLMPFARGDMRDHIVSHKNDYGASYGRYAVLQWRSRLKISFREIFGVVQFSTFATLSATRRHHRCPSAISAFLWTRVSAIDNGRHRVDQATPDELQLI
jgi:hypothetical protein